MPLALQLLPQSLACVIRLFSIIDKAKAIDIGTQLVQKGAIDLSLLNQESLREHIALISQQGYLFDASISDNLRLAKHYVTAQEIRHFCQLVKLTSFTDSLPAGFDTWLDSTRIGLSGGQAQRLQITQLLLRSASVLILDEPTKGLDRQNEEEVMVNILDHVKQQEQNLLVITHKPLMIEKWIKQLLWNKGE